MKKDDIELFLPKQKTSAWLFLDSWGPVETNLIHVGKANTAAGKKHIHILEQINPNHRRVLLTVKICNSHHVCFCCLSWEVLLAVFVYLPYWLWNISCLLFNSLIMKSLILNSSFKAIIITHKQLKVVFNGAVLYLFCREERTGWYFTSTISKLLVPFWNMSLLYSLESLSW